jgi:hypothetical protein
VSKLNIEEKELLQEFVKTDYYSVILKELDIVASSIEADVLKLSLDNGSEKELYLKKARAEGARRLVVAIEQRFTLLKSKIKT